MPVTFDLQASYRSKLDARGISADAKETCLHILREVAEYTGTDDPGAWNLKTLERFLRGRMQSLDTAQRALYSTALALLTELLEQVHGLAVGPATGDFETVHDAGAAAAGGGTVVGVAIPSLAELFEESPLAFVDPFVDAATAVGPPKHADPASPGSASMRLSWDGNERVITVVGQGEISEGRLRAALAQALERASHAPMACLPMSCLIDLHAAVPLSFAAAKILSDWLLGASQSGLRGVAVVSAPHVISRVEVTAARSAAFLHAEEHGKSAVEIAFFEDLTEARRWLELAV